GQRGHVLREPLVAGPLGVPDVAVHTAIAVVHLVVACAAVYEERGVAGRGRRAGRLPVGPCYRYRRPGVSILNGVPDGAVLVAIDVVHLVRVEDRRWRAGRTRRGGNFPTCTGHLRRDPAVSGPLRIPDFALPVAVAVVHLVVGGAAADNERRGVGGRLAMRQH